MNSQLRQQIIDAFKFRHACKSFDARKKIPDEDFGFIMEAARLSPSSFGFEPWKFLVIQNSELRDKIKPVCWGAQGQLPTASHFVIILARKETSMHYGADYIQNHMRNVSKLPEDVVKMKGDFYREFQLQDFKLTESPRAMFDWACKQTYIALGNMMSVAAQIGIDSCPIEGFGRDKLEQILVAEKMMVADEFGVSVMVAFGYRENEPFEKTRFAEEDVIEWF
ncbi:NAD(P)H-dependent oxidoreductase [Parendozoicomonas haliclonae]|uniref:Putative NAD(P)H nitroreductase YfkO n=1 Tax=Parendozoicomonas haliclonae TaxID=1960125 RepID=A0A1X7AN41_9GAMM|nr:NAD(P)H-dependent oxidoreductase [Parendozoicomonas haliclonae]SMA49695.1 putative NAD(P)H nitroreductase YfkO [Parendozoicomonas haliclonae]